MSFLFAKYPRRLWLDENGDDMMTGGSDLQQASVEIEKC
jgi:hypothetical protein